MYNYTSNHPNPRSLAQTYQFRHGERVPKTLLRYVQSELRKHGAVAYDLWLPETHYLPRVLHRDEQIMGSVYGAIRGGRGALIATNQRVIFLDKKPFYVHLDELGYDIVGGITYTRSGPAGHVTLHTRLGDFSLRTFNHKNAVNFVDYIEAQCLERFSPSAEQYKFPHVRNIMN